MRMMLPHMQRYESKPSAGRVFMPALLGSLLFSALIFAVSCGSPPTDIRTVMPSDALVYLETKDLGKAVGSVTRNPLLGEAVKTVADASLLDGMEMAVAVTGFETKEQPLNDESSVMDFQPRFVAVIETRLWNFQVISFVEEHLGLFISEVYGSEATLETSDKHNGKYFVWSGQDGRKAYGLVVGSLIYFGNDESAIEKCLAVGRGEGESIAAGGMAGNVDAVASGFISELGVGQLANIIGISLAKDASDEGDVQSFVARIVPELLRGAVRDVRWRANVIENGVEDIFNVTLNPDLAKVFSETIAPSGAEKDRTVIGALPLSAASFTRYDLRDPKIAWRSIVLAIPTLSEQAAGQLFSAFAGSLFEPYGVADPEAFLGAIGPQIYTAKLDEQGDRVVVFATLRDGAEIKAAVSKDLNMAKPGEKAGAGQTWLTADSGLRIIIDGNKLIMGDPESALEFHRRLGSPVDGFNKNRLFEPFAATNAASVTISDDTALITRIAGVVSSEKPAPHQARSYSMTETRSNNRGLERRVLSDFGLIGSITAQFGAEP